MSFRETKPRKAKYAFEIGLSEDVLSEGELFAAIHKVLRDVREDPDTWWKEFRNGMGTYTLHIYINSEDIYEQVKEAIASVGENHV